MALYEDTLAALRGQYETMFKAKPPGDLGDTEIKNQMASARQYDPTFGGTPPNAAAARAYQSNLSQEREYSQALQSMGLPTPTYPSATPYVKPPTTSLAPQLPSVQTFNETQTAPTRTPSIAAASLPTEYKPAAQPSTPPPITMPTLPPQLASTSAFPLSANGQSLGKFPVLDGSTYVPVRAFIQQLGYDPGQVVNYDAPSDSVYINGQKIPSASMIRSPEGVSFGQLRTVAKALNPQIQVEFKDGRISLNVPPPAGPSRDITPARVGSEFAQVAGGGAAATGGLPTRGRGLEDPNLVPKLTNIYTNIRNGQIRRGSPEWAAALGVYTDTGMSLEQATEHLTAIAEGRKPNLLPIAGQPLPGWGAPPTVPISGGQRVQVPTGVPQAGPGAPPGGTPPSRPPGGAPPSIPPGSPPPVLGGELRTQPQRPLTEQTVEQLLQKIPQIAAPDLKALVEAAMKGAVQSQTVKPETFTTSPTALDDILKLIGGEDFFKQTPINEASLRTQAQTAAELRTAPQMEAYEFQKKASEAREASRIKAEQESARLSAERLKATFEPRIKATQERVSRARLTSSPVGQTIIGDVEKKFREALLEKETQGQAKETQIRTEELAKRAGLENKEVIARMNQGISANADFLKLLQTAQESQGKERQSALVQAVNVALANTKLKQESKDLYQRALDAAESNDTRRQAAALNTALQAFSTQVTANKSYQTDVAGIIKSLLQSQTTLAAEEKKGDVALTKEAITQTGAVERAKATAAETTRREMLTKFGPDVGVKLVEGLTALDAGDVVESAAKFREADEAISAEKRTKADLDLRNKLYEKYGPLAGPSFVGGLRYLEQAASTTDEKDKATLLAQGNRALSSAYDIANKLEQDKAKVETLRIYKDILTDDKIGPLGGKSIISALQNIEALQDVGGTDKEVKAGQDRLNADIDASLAKAAAIWETTTNKPFKAALERVQTQVLGAERRAAITAGGADARTAAQIDAANTRASKALTEANTRFEKQLAETKRHNESTEANARMNMLRQMMDDKDAKVGVVTPSQINADMQKYRVSREAAAYGRVLMNAPFPGDAAEEEKQRQTAKDLLYDERNVVNQSNNDRQYMHFLYAMRFGNLTQADWGEWEARFGTATQKYVTGGAGEAPIYFPGEGFRGGPAKEPVIPVLP